MNDDSLQRHGQALEEAFFIERNRLLLEKLRQQIEWTDLATALRAAAGNLDDATLDYLVRRGIRPDTLGAIKLIPLVAVCWANGVVEPEERKTVLEAAANLKVLPGDPAYDLLESLLSVRPEPELFEAWKRYVHALIANADAVTKSSLKSEILSLSRDVAESAGKVFGYFLGTSPEERAVLNQIEQAFDD